MRFRITLAATVVVAFVLTSSIAVLLVVQQRQLADDLDAGLARRADDVASAIADTGVGGARILPNASGDDALVQVVDGSGRVLVATANAIDLATIGPTDATVGDSLSTVQLPTIDDDDFRVLTRPTEVDGEALVLHVARTTDDQRELLAELRRAAAIMVPLAVAALAAMVWWLVGRTLRPVDAIRTEVASIGGGGLGRRVPEPGTGDEIDRLAKTMNSLLERLDDAARREQRFVADASHELRSPLARMRTTLEVPARASDLPRQELIGEVDEMTALVDDLLVVARDAGDQHPTNTRPVDLDDIVLDEVRRARAAGPHEIDAGHVSAAPVVADPGALRRAVRNVLENACRHASGQVVVELGEQPADGGRKSVLTITDDGPGIPDDQVEAVFERFTRLDGDRSRSSGGTGLGLAIARDIVERHDGTIHVVPGMTSGARVVVELPSDHAEGS